MITGQSDSNYLENKNTASEKLICLITLLADRAGHEFAATFETCEEPDAERMPF